MPRSGAFAQRVAAIRRFTRFYSRQAGHLQRDLLGTPYSLTEAHVLFELTKRSNATATELARELKLDGGYLSRILRRFEQGKLVRRVRSKNDARNVHLTLTARGRQAFAPLDRRSDMQAAAMLKRMSEADQDRVVAAAQTFEALINGDANSARSYRLRAHRPGDMGWVVARHGVLYREEYGWDSTIEAITADIVSAFLKNLDPKRERCWIAEMDGAPVGSVFLVRDKKKDVARLRLLIVDPKARGLGIGRRLVEECIAFARKADYRKITLWTHAVLEGARAIYRQTGFRIVREWVHDDFGKAEASEEWELEL